MGSDGTEPRHGGARSTSEVTRVAAAVAAAENIGEVPKRECTVCGEEFPAASLHRVGFRAMCRECFKRLWEEPCTDEPTPDTLARTEVRSLEHLNLVLLGASALAKTVFFVGIFLWARVSEIGAAALDGFVGAEILTWAVFTVLDRSFRGTQIRYGLLFEIVLVVAYLTRHSIIAVDASPSQMGMTFFFGLLFVTVKSTLWYAETILEMTGVKE
jgi:hypothetical protein